MTPAQYRDALARLGLTQGAAARLLGVEDRTSRRWARQGTRGAAVILLRLLLTGRITPADINYARRIWLSAATATPVAQSIAMTPESAAARISVTPIFI